MSARKRAPRTPRAPRKPKGYCHEALVYESATGLADAVVPLVVEGLEAGERVVVFATSEKLVALQSALDPLHHDGIEMLPFTPDYPRPAQALSTYHRLLRDQARSGQPVRVIGEQPLAGLGDQQVNQWCRVDGAFDAVCAFPHTRVICPFDQSSVPPWVLDNLERSHQVVGRYGERRPSRRYQPSQQMLAEELERTVLEPPSPPVRALPSPASARDARRFIEATADAFGLARADLEDFRIATGEAVANAYRHASIDWVRMWSTGSGVVCEVRDHGPGIRDPLAGYRQPDPGATDGRGLWLAHHLCDEVKIQSGSWGTIIRLYKSLPN